MKQKFLFLSFLFFVNDFCNGQDSTLAKWSVNISPSLLNIPPVDLGIQFGVQYRGGDWGFGAELAFPFQKSNEHYTEMKYRRWGAEHKRFLGRENKTIYRFNLIMRNGISGIQVPEDFFEAQWQMHTITEALLFLLL